MGDAAPSARNDDPQRVWTQWTSGGDLAQQLYEDLGRRVSIEKVLRRSAPVLPHSLVAGRIECHVQLTQWLEKMAPCGRSDLLALVKDGGAGLVALLNVYYIDFSYDVRSQFERDTPLAVSECHDLYGATYGFLFAVLKLGHVTEGADSQQRPPRSSAPRAPRHMHAHPHCTLPFRRCTQTVLAHADRVLPRRCNAGAA